MASLTYGLPGSPSQRWAALDPAARSELEQSFRHTAIAAAAMVGLGGLGLWALLTRRKTLTLVGLGGSAGAYVVGTRLLRESRELARFYGVLGDP